MTRIRKYARNSKRKNEKYAKNNNNIKYEKLGKGTTMT